MYVIQFIFVFEAEFIKQNLSNHTTIDFSRPS